MSLVLACTANLVSLCLLALQMCCDCWYLYSVCVCVYFAIVPLLFLFPTMCHKKIPCTCDLARKGGMRKGNNTLPTLVYYNDDLADMSHGASSLSFFASISTGSSSGSGSDSYSDNDRQIVVAAMSKTILSLGVMALNDVE